MVKKVCQTCGDIGFEEALLYCDSCKVEAIHRYCVGITPTPFTEYVTWICEDCDASDCGSNSIEVDQTAKIGHVLVEEHGVQDDTNVEPVEVSSSSVTETMKESKRRESSDSGNAHEVDQTAKIGYVCLSLCSRMGSSPSDSAILRTWRDLPPPSSSLVKLSQLTNNKYESPQFLSGEHNWRLVLYTKGNEEDNGSGFVSMYVECLSSTPSMDVFAYLTFFVFNKKENKCLSLQDVEVKRFNSSRTVWGLSQAVSLETFNDRANGFVFEGECEFGAHVKIASPPASVDENLPFHKFNWSVRDFSLLKQNDYVSKTFKMGEKKWTLKLYPKGDSTANGELSKSLHLADGEILLAGEMVSVRAQLRVLDPRGSKDLTCSLNSWVMALTKAWGLPQSMPVEDAYLDLEDTLNVETECEVVNVIKNRPFF